MQNQNLDQTPTIDLQQLAVSSDEAIKLLEYDLDFFAAVAIPSIFKYHYPKVFKVIWDWLLKTVVTWRTFFKLAIGLPRGFGKTTFVKLFVLYCILFTKKSFILIVSASSTLAEAILLDIADMLDEENIKKLFGNWRLGLQIDRQDLKLFGFRGRNIVLRAAGAGVGVRGINYKHLRPDVIICEDIQTREQADSEAESRALEQWLLGTLMKTKSPFGCLYIFVGNMYPTEWSLLKKLKHNPEWTSFIVGGILSNFTSLWEELHPLEQLISEMKHDTAAGHYEIFRAEVLNDESASRNYLIDISKIPDNPFSEDELPLGSCIIIDPSTDKQNADKVGIGYFEYFENSKVVATELYEEKYSPLTTIEKALEIGLRKNCRNIAIESNAYQSTLGYWFNYITQQRRIYGFQILEVYSGNVSKAARIISMFKQLVPAAGKEKAGPELYLHKNCKSLALTQILAFDPLKQKNKDNILDLLTHATKVLAENSSIILSSNILVEQETQTTGVSPAEVTCPV
jgi:hypothetical protein